MAHDERNFRSAYYEKVGFRSVEEKKSLEILLKDKPLDIAKLKQFCLRFSVPSTYRNLVWALLLGVLPIYLDCHTFIIDQRNQEYNELLRAMRVLRITDANTNKEQVFLSLFLFQTGRFDINVTSKDKRFLVLVHSFMDFFDNDIDVYWLAKGFYEHIKNYKNDYPKLIEFSWSLLDKEDSTLKKHLQKHNLITNLCLEKWFDNCFAGILHETALAKIWDKICGGSFKILAFVVIMILTNQRNKLLRCTDHKAAMDCLNTIPYLETTEVVVNKAIEMWQQHGSPLTVHDKPKP